MADSQRRSHSEIGRFFNEFNEPLVLEVSEKVSQYLQFWLTYAQAQHLKIENPAILMQIVKLCVRGYRSIDIAQMLEEIEILIPKEFIDRVYLRIKRLMLIILLNEYPDLGLVDPDFEIKEEEERVYNIYTAFTNIPNRISRLTLGNPRFAELIAYNPFYGDFLMLYSSGINVPQALENDGLDFTSAKRFSVTASIVAALSRKNVRNTLFKEAQAWTILTMFPVLVESTEFTNILRRAFLLYVEGDSTTMLNVSEVRRFLEFILLYLFPGELTVSDLDAMTVIQRNATIKAFLEDNFKIEIISKTLRTLIWHYSKYGNFKDFITAVQNPAMVYGRKYIISTFSAAISVIFGCVLLAMHTSYQSMEDEEFMQWISRNRYPECSAILKIVAGVEA